MKREIKGLGDLAVIDGGLVDAAFTEKLSLALQSVADRPGLKSARKIGVQLVMAPRVDATGCLASVEVHVEVTSNLPKEESNRLNMAVSKKALVWNDLSPEDAHQRTIDDEIDNRKRGAK